MGSGMLMPDLPRRDLDPQPEKQDVRPRHIVRDVDGRDGLGTHTHYCARMTGCRVDHDGRSDCCEDACPMCGVGGAAASFIVTEAPGGTFTLRCADCESSWTV